MKIILTLPKEILFKIRNYLNSLLFFIVALTATTSFSAQSKSLQDCSNLIAQMLNSSDIEVTAESLLVLPNSIVRDEIQLQYLCENDASAMESTVFVPRTSEVITVAEEIAIANYTISGTMHFLVEQGARHIPPAAGTYYRGSQSARLKNSKIGDVIKLDRTTSVSKSKKVAIGFMAVQDSQLLIIRAKKARPIHSFSQNSPDGISEEEALLLAGTKIKIVRISTKKIKEHFEGEFKIILNAKIIEAEEVD